MLDREGKGGDLFGKFMEELYYMGKLNIGKGGSGMHFPVI